jgi:hypothetical protein
MIATHQGLSTTGNKIIRSHAHQGGRVHRLTPVSLGPTLSSIHPIISYVLISILPEYGNLIWPSYRIAVLLHLVLLDGGEQEWGDFFALRVRGVLGQDLQNAGDRRLLRR